MKKESDFITVSRSNRNSLSSYTSKDNRDTSNSLDYKKETSTKQLKISQPKTKNIQQAKQKASPVSR